MNIEEKKTEDSKLPTDNVSAKGGDLAKIAADLGVEYLEKAPKKIPPDVLKVISKEVAERHRMVAFARENGMLHVAMVDPQDIDALNALRFIDNKESFGIKIFLVSPETLTEIMAFFRDSEEAIKQAVQLLKEKDQLSVGDGGDREKSARAKKKEEEILKEAPVAKIVQVIISHALEGKASDIHIEPMENDYRVRFRMDGVLHTTLILPKEIGPVVVARVKILSNLKIDEKRKPQDGRFRIENLGRDIDFRVSVLPVLNGEKVAIRILDKEGGVASVKLLGLMGTALESTQKALQESYGMILMTGPTGSGKSTTLYALLKILNKEERNIITLEDPIEYDIEGLNQSQIVPEIGYTFASGLRTILRQDPNVIMVGEIRDGETAELAVHAALTGHLMFSTLHTNTAIGAIPRLIDMGIEPFLLSSSLRCVMAQRLVRKICENCKEKVSISASMQKKILDEISGISPEEFARYELDISQGASIYHGKGCDKCQGTGLRGRQAIYEVVPLTEEMKNIITEKNGDEGLLIKEMKKMGFLTIKQDGIMKILRGDTTVEEVERVTEGEIMMEEQDESPEQAK